MLRYLLLSGLTILVVDDGWTAAYGQSAPTIEDTNRPYRCLCIAGR
jgi:hypothetical protein